jgi:hypothetical protein
VVRVPPISRRLLLFSKNGAEKNQGAKCGCEKSRTYFGHSLYLQVCRRDRPDVIFGAVPKSKGSNAVGLVRIQGVEGQIKGSHYTLARRPVVFKAPKSCLRL